MMTLKGELDENVLEKKEAVHERPTGVSTWTEYYYHGELVRRDIHNRQYTIEERQAKAIAKDAIDKAAQ